MEWYDRYKKQLELIYTEAEQRIAAFPVPLNTIGLLYADKFNPVKHDSGKDYICSLLPFWVQEAAGINDEQCRKLALANVYGMLYFFIQDDVMDSTPSSNWKEQLALGNLLVLEMFAVFRELFPSESTFWQYYNRYVTTWADSVINEKNDNYFITDPLKTAGKAGPVKIACTGALLLSSRFDMITVMEEAIDITLMTLQMADDWVDWQEDLAEGSYNSLLAMITSDRQLDRQPTVEEADASIYIRGCMKSYVQVACDNHNRLLAMKLDSTELVDFHAYLLNHLNQTSDSIDSNRAALHQGGFNYFFSQNLTK